jgi:hypothetical protein
MAGKSKKMAAVLAAVSMYLQEEEAQLVREQAAAGTNAQNLEFNQWGQSGRQEMMAMRKLIQLRAFTR